MGAQRIFKSDEARARLAEWYDKFLAKIDGPVERREVPTAQGPSHVLLAGDPANPPLVCLHGSLASSAHLLSELTTLLARYRLILPDLPGQSVKGPQVRMSYKDDSLARWVVEVLDGLGVGTFDLLGVSWGGFAARMTATFIPDRVRKLVLLVPAGVVTGPVWKGITQMAIPLTLYKLFPSERRLKRFFTPLFTTWDDDWAGYMGRVPGLCARPPHPPGGDRRATPEANDAHARHRGRAGRLVPGREGPEPREGATTQRRDRTAGGQQARGS